MGKRTGRTYATYEAKAKFSEIIKRVREGDVVRVSYHGRTVAEIRPVYETDVERRLVELEQQGVLDPPAAPGGKLEAIARKPGALRRFLESRD